MAKGKGEKSATSAYRGDGDSPTNEGDPSRKLPAGPSVNAEATRSTASRSHTLGPRTA